VETSADIYNIAFMALVRWNELDYYRVRLDRFWSFGHPPNQQDLKHIEAYSTYSTGST
jgi:hypothetical protein